MFVVGGFQVSVAAPVAVATTAMLNAGSAVGVLTLPSLTLITMPVVVPTFAAVGVPVRAPVAVLNCAHDGLFTIVNVSVSPLSASLAVGVNE